MFNVKGRTGIKRSEKRRKREKENRTQESEELRVRVDKTDITEKQTKDPEELGEGIRVLEDKKVENSLNERQSKRRKHFGTSREAKEQEQCRHEDEELKVVLYHLRKEVQTLTGKVKQLTNENRELHAKVRALETITRIQEDDEGDCMDWEDERWRE